MARTTPGTGIPVPESPDPRTITADLWASFSKVGQLITQTSGESSAALVTAEQAKTAAAQALARALLIEDPIHVGPSEPTEGEELWVDTDEDAPPTPVSVSSEDITDATEVGRNVLTAPLSVDARNALSIFTGTRALLDAGTDEAERTWDAKELHEYVTETAENAGGAASWDDLTGKPATYPPATHTHEITDVDGLAARLAALERDTGVRDIRSLFINGWSHFVYSPTLQRIGPWCELRAYVIHADATDDVLMDIPLGFRPGGSARPVGTIYGSSTTEARAFIVNPGDIAISRSRLIQSQHMLSAVWITRDPWPTTLPGDPA